MKIVIETTLVNITLSENDIIDLLEERKMINSILLMLINNDDTWENANEVEFSREEAKDFLKGYFKDTNYCKSYIKNTLEKITR